MNKKQATLQKSTVLRKKLQVHFVTQNIYSPIKELRPEFNSQTAHHLDGLSPCAASALKEIYFSSMLGAIAPDVLKKLTPDFYENVHFKKNVPKLSLVDIKDSNQDSSQLFDRIQEKTYALTTVKKILMFFDHCF